jgi:hypothetical protein
VRRVPMVAACGLVAGLTWCFPGSAQAAGVADWQMDETVGSPLMVDASGGGLDGHIGPGVVLHEATPSGWGYGFGGDPRIVSDNRLVTWPDDDRLDPGTQPYAVTLRVKTTALDPNIVQKGQANQAGGYWKFELVQGWPVCLFRDQNGRTKAIGFRNDARPQTRVADNQWHTLRCERTATGVRMTINYGEPGAISKFSRGTIGAINSSRPMSLGGKLDCNGRNVGCDYFAGTIDWLTIERPGV